MASEVDTAKALLSDKSIHASRGALTRLWRTVLIERGTTPADYGRYMDRYISRTSGEGCSSKLMSQNRGNAVKFLSGNAITFKVFAKGMYFLGMDKASLTIAITLPDGTYTEHTSPIDSTKPDSVAGMAAMWCKVRTDLLLTPTDYSRLLDIYIPKISMPGSSTKQLSQNRGTTVKDLRKNVMTYKTFLKGMMLLGASSILISVDIEANGNSSTHQVSVTL